MTLVKKHGYKLGHAAIGFIIGIAGLAGLPLALFVIFREWAQETEQVGNKSRTNVAWKDMNDWIGGVLVGVALRLIFW